TTDADCGGNLLCSPASAGDFCYSPRKFSCQSRADSCETDADCASVACPDCTTCGNKMLCVQGASGRSCQSVGCGCAGRPFLVHGAERVATVCRGDGWSPAAPIVPTSNADDRQKLARAWADIALMEHASIAAFARFTLQLLSLGAPADLVSCSNSAQADETLHAELCFGIASAYAGHAVAPGPLHIDGSLDQTSLIDVLVNVIREGC